MSRHRHTSHPESARETTRTATPSPLASATSSRQRETGGRDLRIGPANDRYEREAHRLAASVTGQPVRGRSLTGGDTLAYAAAPPLVHQTVQQPGRPLDEGTRQTMEARFGADFSGVRVHTDGRAAESAAAIQSRAYTVGRDIVFNDGAYQPNSAAGRALLAHELTHTLQQTQSKAR